MAAPEARTYVLAPKLDCTLLCGENARAGTGRRPPGAHPDSEAMRCPIGRGKARPRGPAGNKMVIKTLPLGLVRRERRLERGQLQLFCRRRLRQIDALVARDTSRSVADH